MTQLGHTSTTTVALYTNPEQEKAKKESWVREEPIIVKRIKKRRRFLVFAFLV
ncbi:hypothetical protein [Peribacillus sp. NPDC058075]|uniref:hypothetical protein n=1 Tax=unclassified Peribacillus TaxID=2675266 RepID=UPI0036DB59C8